jgi:FMN-dependent oxidoreductase (nitrilotriacetate monooxygenase family)
MAAVTKNLAFGITVSTSFESPFMLAKRFSTLDHLTDGRIGWNIVTSWKASAFKAIGMAAPTEHDQRYAIADEYLRVLYKLWEGSWADDAVVRDAETDTYVDPSKLRKINHHGKHFNLETPHIVDPSPQRTPFLFQAGVSTAGAQFAAQHAEGVFVSGQTTAQLRPKVDLIRKNAKEQGRDPRSIKIFGTFMPIIGQTEEEAQAKLAVAKKYTSTIGGLVLASSWTGIDLSKLPLDEEIPEDLVSEDKHRRTLSEYTKTTAEITKWTPRLIGEKIGLSAIGPIAVGTPEQVADEMERWIEEADLDGFNVGYITTPGTFEDVIDLLIPELRRRGVYPEKTDEGLTAREKIYGKGQSKLRDDHTGSKYKYHVYREDPPYVAESLKRQRVD